MKKIFQRSIVLILCVLFLIPVISVPSYAAQGGIASDGQSGVSNETAQYTLSYDANGGKDAPSQQIKLHDVDLQLHWEFPRRDSVPTGEFFTVTLDPTGGKCDTTSLSAPTNTIYNFRDWNTKKDGSGKEYYPGSDYTENASATMYAQWNQFTVSDPVTLPDATKDGYSFIGWATDGNATSVWNGNQFWPWEDTTFLAIWSAPGHQFITENPTDKTVNEGKNVTFTVKAVGNVLKYQWQVKKPGSSTWVDIPGETSSKLLFTAKASHDGNQYRCVVSSSTGEDTSDAAQLKVVVAKPKITTQPKAAKVKAGRKVTFKVKAKGLNLKYQWYRLKPGTKKWVKISKATKATYSFKAAKKWNRYKYRCLVKNAAGKVYTKAVKLTVK